MNILVIGTGLVGQAVVTEAQNRNLNVEVASHSGKNGIALDISKTEDLAAAINSHDATVIAVSGRPNYTTVIEAHKKLVEHGFEGRLLVVVGAGSLEVDGTPLAQLPDFPAEYKPEADAFAEILNFYKNSSATNWTAISPSPMIDAEPGTGRIVLGTDSPAGDYVAASDFAKGIVDEIQNPAHKASRFTIATLK
ncbi:MAG: NAD(P)H-binding protein [Corynebacterium sp.]|nr:NAD(P)H-binding protein [Corynebacterium sp.]